MLLSIRTLVWVVPVLAAAGPVRAQQTLTDFRPSSRSSGYGVVSEIEFSTGLVGLESGMLAHHVAPAMKTFRFAEDVWVIGYKTDIQDSRGNTPRENYLCHTFLSDQRMAQRQDDEVSGIYSDAFTPEISVPDGFGIPLARDELLHWMPMFNNRTDDSVRVQMKVLVTVIRARDLKKPLKRLYAGLRSVQVPHLFFVPPGTDERRVTFVLPFNAKIHLLGTHIHPYGDSVELYNATRNERVWKGERKKQPDGPMEIYTNAAGYAVKAGETYRITSVYKNTTADKIDAMAGLFILYSRD
jgi:hypothetical protein